MNKDLQPLLKAVEDGLKALPLQANPDHLYSPIAYTLALGGKRMRPVCTLLACGAMGADPLKALPQALGLELFHNFTLLHDDIMDAAPLRRGKPTVHKQWNTNVAILSGDVMFVMACQQMSMAAPEQLANILKIYYAAAVEVCEGQQYDMLFENRSIVAEQEYLHMIELKTAALLGACLEIGALVGGAREATQQRFKAFGRHLGIAFQLKDDLLDVFGSPEEVGKQPGGDIISNKKTILLIKALERAQGESQKQLHRWLENTMADPAEKVAAVTALFAQLGVESYAEQLMRDHYALAMEALSQTGAQGPYFEAIQQLAEALMQRTS